jgi:phycobilisome linker polypeptide/EF hand domain-containing protein
MLRAALCLGALIVVPAVASAQQPCTSDARRVVDETYRHMLERSPDPASEAWVQRLNSGSTVRDVVREIAKSPEHVQRWGNESREQVARTLYRHVLNNVPDANTVRSTGNLISRNGIPAAVDQIVNSPQYQQMYGDWGVPGASGVRFCAPNERGNQNQVSQISSMRFRRMDTNNDGRITREEWRGNAQAFQNYDWNNDGVLSGEEVSVNGVRRGNARNDEVQNDDRFDYLDVNGNGFIDRNEWDGGRYVFDRLDSNRDNRLNRDEWEAVGRSSNNFATLDANHDGRLTLNEWPWTHRAFDDQDTNRDGVLSRQEFQGSPTTRRN